MIPKPITVLYLIDTYLPPPGSKERGGAEKQLSLLAGSLDATRFRPIVVQLGWSGMSTPPDYVVGAASLMNVPVRRIYSFHGLWQVYQLSRMARREKVDIIQAFFEKSEVIGWMISRLAGIPHLVISRRDLGFKRKSLYKNIFKIIGSDCSSCVAVCRAVGEQVLSERVLTPGKVEVIYNGLDIKEFRTPLADVRSELGIAEGTPLVGMVANMNFEIKGHRYFLQAAKLVLANIPSVEFLLVGDGPLRDKYQTLADELGIGGRVHFIGKRNDTPAILSSLDVSVLCSTSEGMSNVIMESMAAGKPVVATRVGGNPELVEDGVTGLLVPPADVSALAEAMQSLLSNTETAMALGAAGMKLVTARFTVETMVHKHEQLYGKLMKESMFSIG